MTDYIIYHQVKKGSDCPDGIAAAWIASKAFPSARIVGAVYQSPLEIEPQKGDRLIIVDFSFPALQMEGWVNQGIEVTIIDHHKTALENLAGLSDRILQRFDMNECGATLAWKHLFPDSPMPAFLEFVRSRDLWLDCELFADPLPETLIVHEAMAQLRFDFKHSREGLFFALNELAQYSRIGLLNWAKDEALDKLMEKRETVKAIASRFGWDWVVKWSWRKFKFEVFSLVPVVCLKQDESRYASDVCMVLYRQFPQANFVACLMPDGAWSLRSDGKGRNFDVSAVAKAFGGGGHRNAAGYKPRQKQEDL